MFHSFGWEAIYLFVLLISGINRTNVQKKFTPVVKYPDFQCVEEQTVSSSISFNYSTNMQVNYRAILSTGIE